MYIIVVAITACDVYLERFKSAWELGTWILDLHQNLRQAKPSKQLWEECECVYHCPSCGEGVQSVYHGYRARMDHLTSAPSTLQYGCSSMLNVTVLISEEQMYDV
jgi:hypothetical protein